ncbi:MAG: CbbQ/NirQ/NorQ/GpvN family protein [Alphaproteobacteria bacterium]|nr:CbbQ/NirQ/NorQ/GpvN family protein [Alphaproteobacteria bacterium]
MRTITPPVDDFLLPEAPWYLPEGDEVELFERAAAAHLPVILKGPTGCGKTRFVSYMAHKLGRPLVTVACHEDLTASDLLGRFLILGDETVWCDGPLTIGVRHGAVVYLDEVVEARNDTMVVIHPLTDDRRILPVEKLGAVLRAPPEFMLVVSYNPGYQSVLKEMKQSTRQRFISLDFTYPRPDVERTVVARESGCGAETAERLVKLGGKVRNLTDRGLEEGVSTRLLIYAGRLVAQGVDPRRACEVSIARTLTDDVDLQRSIREVVNDFF